MPDPLVDDRDPSPGIGENALRAPGDGFRSGARDDTQKLGAEVVDVATHVVLG